MAIHGRGKHFSRLRGGREWLQRMLYRGNWPARLWGLSPNAGRVDLIEQRLAIEGLSPMLRVGFASDLHLGPTTSSRTLARAFDLLAAASPDVLVLGGDLVSLSVSERVARELASLVERVPARTKIAVWGNHDLWTDHALLQTALEGAGVRVLVNDAVILPPPHDQVAFLGLDDPWTGEPDAERALAACGTARIKLAVAHSPEAVPLLQGRGVSLLLAGHTHGGQIALPGSIPIVRPQGTHSRRWLWGRHQIDGMTLFVSRGVGASDLPMRFFAPPDVSIWTIGG